MSTSLPPQPAEPVPAVAPPDAAASPPPQPDRPDNWLDGEWNYFAAQERPLQHRFRAWRDQLLTKVVDKCLAWHLNADAVSAIGFGMLLPFGLLTLGANFWGSQVLAGLCLLLHVFLDGLDGPVARRLGTANRVGAFTDMCLDHIGFLVVAVVLAAAGLVHGAAATAYASSYTLAIVLVVLLNLLQKPLWFMVRTKYAFYAVYFLYILGGPNWMTYAALGFAGLHTIFVLIGFLAVRRALAQ